jgi:flagellar hook-basal body complex protein FliE
MISGDHMGKREAYQEKMEAQLAQLNAKIDEFVAKAKEASADAKIEYYKQADELSAKQKKAEAQLEELKRASADAWEEMMYGMDSAFTDLQTAFNRAAAKFK